MPDGTSRFYKDGEPLHHYMGCSTFSEYTVLPEISLAKVNKSAPLESVIIKYRLRTFVKRGPLKGDLMHRGESIRSVIHF